MNESIQQRRPNPVWTAIVCGMASYIDAASIVSWGLIAVIYQAIYHLSAGQIGILSGMLTFCIAIGALSGGYLGDRFGRRTVFLFTMFGILIGVVGMILTSTYSLMLVCSALVGISTGADLPVSLATIAETSTDEKQRGTLLGLSQILWTLGMVAVMILGMAVGNLGKTGAQIILGQIAVVSALVLLGRISIPESAVWKASNSARKAGVQTKKEEKVSVSNLFRAPYAAPFIALILFYGLCNAAFNVLGQYGTYLLVNVAKVDVAKASSTGLIQIPLLLIGSLLFMKTVRTKRRTFYFLLGSIGYLAGFLLPAILGVTLNSYLITLVFAGISFCFAGEAIMKFWCQTSFPTMYRATAQGTIIAVGRFTAAGFAVVVPFIIAADPRLLFVAMAVMCFVGGLIAWAVFRKRNSTNEDMENKAVDSESELAAE